MKKKNKEAPGRIREQMKIVEGNLHKRDRRDHEPIKDHLGETPVKLENDS